MKLKSILSSAICFFSIGLSSSAQAQVNMSCVSDSGKSYFTVVQCGYISRNGSSAVILPGAGYRFSNFRFNGYSSVEPTTCFRRTSGGLAMRMSDPGAESVAMLRREFAWANAGQNGRVKVLYSNGKTELFSCRDRI